MPDNLLPIPQPPLALEQQGLEGEGRRKFHLQQKLRRRYEALRWAAAASAAFEIDAFELSMIGLCLNTREMNLRRTANPEEPSSGKCKGQQEGDLSVYSRKEQRQE